MSTDSKAQILIISHIPEDCEQVRLALEGLPYVLHVAESGVEGMVRASTVHPDLILLEGMLPYLDGFEVCGLIRSHYALGEIPVILMSARGDADLRLAGLRAGADDFIIQPINRLELIGRLHGLIRLNRYRLILETRRHAGEAEMDENAQRDLELAGWSRVLELSDKETEQHNQRVTTLTLALGRAAGLSEEELHQVWRGTLLHDIGVLGIPNSIIKKPGSLDEAEWRILREHPTHAYHWFCNIDYLRPALDIPYCHHEKWDGSGYPRGLRGQEIPFAARLFAVVDVWDALTSDRPYRAAMSEAEAMDYIQSQAGKHFDPQVVELFMANRDPE
jgi:putative two-component system response regulator